MSDIEKVKQLREATGAGFKDCNSAVKESNGDLEKAVDSTISDFMTLRLKLSFKYSMQPSVEPVSTIMTSSK